MKLTPARRKIVAFMSGPYGRITRAIMGTALVAVAVLNLGWYLLLLAPAAFLIWSAATSFCPVAMLFPQIKEEEKLSNRVSSYKLKI
jgi:hypothetical protein